MELAKELLQQSLIESDMHTKNVMIEMALRQLEKETVATKAKEMAKVVTDRLPKVSIEKPRSPLFKKK